MTIKQVSKKYNISADTLRYYEKAGVIPPVTRTSGGIRDYTDEDIAWVKNAICMRSAGLPCTACHYCTSHCPRELQIPELISLYNEHKVSGGGFIAPMAVAAMPENKRPSNCIGCRSCESVCPQQIKISDMMKDFSSMIGM